PPLFPQRGQHARDFGAKRRVGAISLLPARRQRACLRADVPSELELAPWWRRDRHVSVIGCVPPLVLPFYNACDRRRRFLAWVPRAAMLLCCAPLRLGS